jgi:hypothetical protein
MALNNPSREEIRRRIEQLHSITETPSRKRELLALERTLVESISQASNADSTRKIVRKRRAVAKYLETEETTPDEPVRRVERKEGTRRIIISTRKPDDTDNIYESAKEKKVTDRMKHDIQAMIGNAHRGMS